ncbi:hypothetical protein EVAR_38786_1 [Eumeta japonica]|uniref:Uncharacterized protein n=1 Tax=Eumeta variegata TaxID=151549 RepID=A0A4C1WLL5_EUMVA|nr:hypothetical protein EVAR_38786_1 [Eumeta japonica]
MLRSLGSAKITQPSAGFENSSLSPEDVASSILTKAIYPFCSRGPRRGRFLSPLLSKCRSLNRVSRYCNLERTPDWVRPFPNKRTCVRPYLNTYEPRDEQNNNDERASEK